MNCTFVCLCVCSLLLAFASNSEYPTSAYMEYIKPENSFLCALVGNFVIYTIQHCTHYCAQLFLSIANVSQVESNSISAIFCAMLHATILMVATS